MSRPASGVREEYRRILDVLSSTFSGSIDGRSAILEMKEKGMNWRQMEWPGWYTEEVGRHVLKAELGGDRGPRYGSTTFDYRLTRVWDLNAHVASRPNGRRSDIVILNDCEAIRNVVLDEGGLGYVIAALEAEYDTDGSFKRWHDELKGSVSKYEQERISRKAPVRRRKTGIRVLGWVGLWLGDFSDVDEGMGEWFDVWQPGLRNADGSDRRPKLRIHLSKIPDKLRL